MKSNFNKSGVRLVFRREAAQGGCCHASARRGIALIITLIILAIITFMAITFLVLSHQQRGAVATTTDQTTARFAARSAMARAESELLARMIANKNDQDYSMIVSTNYINRAGFQTDPSGYSSFTNVCYYYPKGDPLRRNDQFQNLANLFYDPRPPVYVTNPAPPYGMDFRYYLDLNRNGRDDPNGLEPEISPDPALPYYDAKTGDLMGPPLPNPPPPNDVLSNYFVGDPEWIGVLNYPSESYSADNLFNSRYAFLVVPAAETLDVNYIHNESALDRTHGGQPYRRDMGVGTWEINLAAFLADLNTNIWDPPIPPSATYDYALPWVAWSLGNNASGVAFDDADALLRYRYGGSANRLAGLSQLFRNANALQYDGVDEFGGGGLPIQYTYMTNVDLPTRDADLGRVNNGWPGADNPNHFFNTQDFYNPAKVSPGFVNRLTQAGKSTDSYDRYTFYRMLAQLGTDSEPSPGKLNLDYLNVDTYGNVVPGMETNMIPWGDITGYPAPGPLFFFTNVADRIFKQMDLRDTNGLLITTTHIPVYPDNYYTPAVNRVLQLAANIFEATTNSLYPCIYRPYFTRVGYTNIDITGYELVNGPDDLTTAQRFLDPPIDLADPLSRLRYIGITPTSVNVYGFPWIIGARKGFPNLNEVDMQSVAQITRKLIVRRQDTTTTDFTKYHTSQLIMMGISNAVAVEVWNSYRTNYPYSVPHHYIPRNVYIRADGQMFMTLTNDDPGFPPRTLITRPFNYGGEFGTRRGIMNIGAGQWPGTHWNPQAAQSPAFSESFQVPLVTNIDFLPESAYSSRQKRFVPVPSRDSQAWDLNNPDSFPQFHWGLNITNRIRCYIMDGTQTGRVVDYVQLSGLNDYRDLTGEIYSSDASSSINNMWSTNFPSRGTLGYMPQGLVNQINVAAGVIPTTDEDWARTMIAPPSGDARITAIAEFASFLHLNVPGYPTLLNTNLVMQVPYTPTSRRYVPLRWQANDPLVHYTASDLTDLSFTNFLGIAVPPNAAIPSVTSNLWAFTGRYDPWGGASKGVVDPALDVNMAIKDPMVRASDDWNFPTNVLPNPGWLGRVHRGTPWQTVYLKASDVAPNLKQADALKDWRHWTGDNATWFPNHTNSVADAWYSRPVEDRKLFELFTTAMNNNATRGRLSVNQPNLAAWSAVLSGVPVLENNATNGTVNATVIQPAGLYDAFQPADKQPALVQIWRSINDARNKFPGQVFTNLADVLAAPKLTEQSPYLNFSNLKTDPNAGGLSDAVVERIPQQILGLLTITHDPRFVIYAYGQTLHPAENSVYTGSGTYFGMCTNYQITAESALRAVVHVEGSFDPKYTRQNPDPNGNYYPPHLVVEQYNVLPPD